MSKASEWAKAMQEHRLARPSCIMTVQDAKGGQEAGQSLTEEGGGN